MSKTRLSRDVDANIVTAFQDPDDPDTFPDTMPQYDNLAFSTKDLVPDASSPARDAPIHVPQV